MPVTRRIDTSMYGNPNRGTGISNILNLIQGVRGVTGLAWEAKDRRATQQAQSDDEYIDSIFGKNLAGWNGADYNDFSRRGTNALNEVLSSRPDLYDKVMGELEKSMQTSMGAQKFESEQMGRTLKNAGMELGNIEAATDIRGKNIDIEKKSFENKMMERERSLLDSKLIASHLANAQTPQEFNNGKLHLQALGINTSIPDFQTFSQNREMYIDKIAQNQVENERMLEDLKVKGKQLDVKKAGADIKETEIDTAGKVLSNKLAQKEIDWYDKKNQALIDKMKNSSKGTGGGKAVLQNVALKLSATKQGIDQIDNLVDKSPSFTALTNSPLDKVRSLNPWDKDVQAFNQLIAMTKQVIGKGLEGGVLRKEDEYKYEKILPRLGEPLDVRRQKAQQLRDMLTNKYNTDVESLGKTGANVENFEKAKERKYGEQGKVKRKVWNEKLGRFEEK